MGWLGQLLGASKWLQSGTTIGFRCGDLQWMRKPMVIEGGSNTRLRYEVFGILLAAAGFFAEGIYILATGFLSPAGDRRPASARPMRLLARLWAGSPRSAWGSSLSFCFSRPRRTDRRPRSL